MGIWIHKAKKDHQCDLCGKKIPEGDQYWRDYQKSKDGFVIKDHKEHTNCELYKDPEHHA